MANTGLWPGINLFTRGPEHEIRAQVGSLGLVGEQGQSLG